MMSTIARVISGSLLLAVGLVGYGEYTAPSVVSVEQECERSGGVWRAMNATCQHEAPKGDNARHLGSVVPDTYRLQRRRIIVAVGLSGISARSGGLALGSARRRPGGTRRSGRLGGHWQRAESSTR